MLALTLLAALLTLWGAGSRGLELAVAGPGATSEEGRRVGLAEPGSRALNGLDLGAEPVRVTWKGVWRVPSAGRQRLRARADGDLQVDVDDDEVLAVAGGRAARRTQASFDLEGGLHRLRIDWTAPRGARLELRWAPPGEGFRDLGRADLLPRRPSWVGEGLLLARPAATIGTEVGLVLLVLLLSTLLVAGRRGADWGIGQPGSGLARAAAAVRGRLPHGKTLARLLAVLIVFYGAALRGQALIDSFWDVDDLGLVAKVRPFLEAVTPDSFHWPQEVPYRGGDPAAYLRYGRAMKDFYEARVREPLFVFATRLGLLLAHDNNIGVGIASATFSALAVGAVYLLGAFGFGRPVGLLAALAFAVERRVIGLSIEGWRDDAFAFFVTLFAYALLRLYARSTFLNSVLLGLVAGFSWLTRITSLSFLLPSFLALAFFPRARPRRERLSRLALSVGLCLLLMAPFLANCWIAHGDAFYAINEYTSFFRERSGHVDQRPLNVIEYVAAYRPFELADKVLIGMTAHPFLPKWNFEDWLPALGPVLATASVIGLFAFLFLPRGRLLLLVHATAMVPFSLSWDIRGGSPWRHSLHAYPFYLVAAGLVLVGAARLVVSAPARAALRSWLSRRRAVAVGAVGCGLLVAAPVLSYGLRYLRVGEAIGRGDPSTLVLAGPRDACFFGRGWYPPVHVWNWHSRFMRDRQAVVFLPLERGTDYRLVLRLDPFVSEPGRPLHVEVFLNGTAIGSLTATGGAGSGRHPIFVPARLVRGGRDRLELRADHTWPASRIEQRPEAIPEDWAASLELRYVRVVPVQPGDEAPPEAREDGEPGW